MTRDGVKFTMVAVQSRGARTLATIEQAVTGRHSATLVAVTNLLDALSRKGDTASLAELAALVQCDVLLSTRVLAQANTFGCNGNAPPVSSLSEAFHKLGIDRLRGVVLASLLAQHAVTPNQAQREVAVLSLVKGIVAQSLAEACHHDPEQAFLVGALRNYGHLLLATFIPDEFDRAQEEIGAGRDEDAAFREVFGLTPRQLAHTMLEAIPLSPELLEAIAREPSLQHEDDADSLSTWGVCADTWGDWIFDPRLPPVEFRERSVRLLESLAPATGIRNPEDLNAFLARQRRQFSDYARYVGFAPIAERPVITLSRRIGNKPLHQSPIIPGRDRNAPPAVRRRPAKLDADALPRLVAGLGADEALLFALETVDGPFRFVRAHGSWAQGLSWVGSFVGGDRSLFGLCAALHQSFLIHDSTAPTIRGHLPTWMQSSPPASFLLLPLGDQGTAQVLLVGWTVRRQVAPLSPRDALAFNP